MLLGNSYPLGETMLALVFGTIVAGGLSSVTVFARRGLPSRRAIRILTALVAFDVLAIPGALLVCNLLTSKPYERKDLKPALGLPATVDVTGTWRGSWTDPRKKITQSISLKLNQSGNEITGTIVDGEGNRFRIIEGMAGGTEINLFYDRASPAWPSGGATLIGRLEAGRLSGSYYAHQRPRPGGASSGPWHADRVTTEAVPEAPQSDDGLPSDSARSGNTVSNHQPHSQP